MGGPRIWVGVRVCMPAYVRACVRVCVCVCVCVCVSWSGCLGYLLDGLESAHQLAYLQSAE